MKWLVAGLVVLVFALYLRGNVFRSQAVSALLRGDSLEASHDSTRRIFQGDHQRQERRIVQSELRRDSLDKQLKRTTTLLAQLSAQVRGVDTVLIGQVQEDSGVRRARFRADSPPYHIEATAALPPPPQPASLEATIRLDPARLQMRTQCGQPVRGVRPASLLFSGPDWLSFTIDYAQQEPIYCNPSLVAKRHSTGYFVLRGGVGGVVLAILASAVF